MIHSLAQFLTGSYAVIAALLWGAMTCLLPLVPRRRQVPVFWASIILGVPVLGWLTFAMGPGVGVLAMGLGLLILVRSPFGGRKKPLTPNADAGDLPPGVTH